MGTEYKRCRGGAARRGTNETTGAGHCNKPAPIGDKIGENILERVHIRKKGQLDWVMQISPVALTWVCNCL